MNHEIPKVLVVGGASGIGKATVRALMKEKFSVIAADLNEASLKDLSAKNPTLHTVRLDITQKESIANALKDIREKFKTLKTVIITAGKHSAYPAEFVPDEVIDHILNVNLISHIKFVRDVIPLIEKGGKLIGVSSLAGSIAVPMLSIYSASKFGLEGFYEALAIEVSYRPIQVTLIQPGNVNTGFNETGNDYRPVGVQFVDDGYRRVVDKINSRSGMTPEAVAEIILKAVRSNRSRFLYLAGFNARKAYYARNLLGRTIARNLIAKHFGF